MSSRAFFWVQMSLDFMSWQPLARKKFWLKIFKIWFWSYHSLPFFSKLRKIEVISLAVLLVKYVTGKTNSGLEIIKMAWYRKINVNMHSI